MERNKIDELVAKYNEGLADPEEVQQLELLLENGQVELTQLRYLEKLDQQILKIEGPAASLKMDDVFYSMLAMEKKKERRSFSYSLPEWRWLGPRLAVAAVLLIAGFVGGYLFPGRHEKMEVTQLNRQVGELKEMIMLSLLEKESATDRLKAVNLTSEMDQVSQKVTQALFETLNNDANVNVRLASLEALKPYSRESKVREELIRSIGKQESPLVQMALSELMAALQEKRSIGELEKIIRSDKTPVEVKDRIKESIKILI